MKFRTVVMAAILALGPSIGLAEGCSTLHDEQQAMSCAEGMQWDTATSVCVPIVTG